MGRGVQDLSGIGGLVLTTGAAVPAANAVAELDPALEGGTACDLKALSKRGCHE